MSAASKCDQCGVYTDAATTYIGRSPFGATPEGWLIVHVTRVPEQSTSTESGEFCSFSCASEWVEAAGERANLATLEAIMEPARERLAAEES